MSAGNDKLERSAPGMPAARCGRLASPGRRGVLCGIAKLPVLRRVATPEMLTAIAATEPILPSAAEPYLWALLAAGLVGVMGGFFAVWFIMRQSRRLAEQSAQAHLELAKREAAVAAQEMISKAEEDIRNREAEMNRDFDRRKIEVELMLREIRSHEESLALLDYQLEQRQERLAREASAIKQARDAMRDLSKSLRKRLEGAAHLDGEEIRKQLRDEVAFECQEELRALRKELIERSEQEVVQEGKRILVAAMQRLAGKPNNDITATIVQLPSEEMKGRIIGREGRNIKSFEAATGCTLLIDESPQMVLISSFDPVRREVAKLALEGLVKDGRIHPASIEEYVGRARQELDLHVAQIGEEAVDRLKISGLHPEVIKLLGKLRFRFSYTQNVLDHSIEVAQLCSMLASELGLEPNVAKRAGLLHDIGKAIEGEYEGSHALIGADFVRRYGETTIVVNAVAAHHNEVKPETIYAGLVILADAVSASRPGARAESMTSYIERLGRLEKLAMTMPGVQQAFAIQAGREVRVVVQPNVVTDEQAHQLAKALRKKIEEELDYPSTIKITVIREQRYTETAT